MQRFIVKEGEIEKITGKCIAILTKYDTMALTQAQTDQRVTCHTGSCFLYAGAGKNEQLIVKRFAIAWETEEREETKL